MAAFISALKLVAIGILGYIVIALGQVLVLEVILRGRLAVDAPLSVLVIGTLGTIVSGLVGGYLTARLGGARPLLHVAAVMAVLAFDAVFVITNRVGGNPIWFDLGGAFTLMAATAAGGWWRSRSVQSGPSDPEATSSLPIRT